jgi:hypothetical protein
MQVAMRATVGAVALIVVSGMTAGTDASATPQQSPHWAASTTAATAVPAATTAVRGGQLRVWVTGDRLGQQARIKVRGLTGRAKGLRRKISVDKKAVLRGLAAGKYRITAAPITVNTLTSVPVTKRVTTRVTARRGARVPVGYRATCTQATVTFSSLLVPSCGLLSGAVANAFGNRPGWPEQGPDSHRRFEQAVGATFGIYTYYFTGSQNKPFPRDTDIAFLREAGANRVMMAHWKVADDMTFADVVAGKADARIDAQAQRLTASFPEKIFVALQSEMEIQVDESAGSGRTARDYAAMYRYVVDRMRAQGVRNVIWVLSYGGFGKWATKPWFADLYPGDRYVDWIGWHPYTSTDNLATDLAGLLNSTLGATDPRYRGMYNYLTRRHPGKPLMLSEFGVFHDPRNPTSVLSRKASFYRSVGNQLPRFPAIRAMVQFDTDSDQNKANGYDISVLSNSRNLAAFRRMARLSWLVDPRADAGPVR